MTTSETPPGGDAVVLLGRGGTGASAREALLELQQALQALLPPGCQVAIAFVDKAAPSLPEALDGCAVAARIAIVPLFAPDEPALRRWLHKLVMRWRATRPEARAHIAFAPPLLQAADLPALLLQRLPAALASEDVAREAGEQWQRDPQAWSEVPPHSHHALVCTGPRCTALGAMAVWQELTGAIQADAALRARLRPLQTSCQYPCNHGPLVILYPDGVWYGRLEAGSAARVLRAHVLEGRASHGHHVHGPLPAPPRDI
jgi:(2Fe-2S) ferredoxin